MDKAVREKALNLILGHAGNVVKITPEMKDKILKMYKKCARILFQQLTKEHNTQIVQGLLTQPRDPAGHAANVTGILLQQSKELTTGGT